MQDEIIDIVNRTYCYDQKCQDLAIDYRYCIFSCKSKDKEMKEKCSKILNEYLKCRNENIFSIPRFK